MTQWRATGRKLRRSRQSGGNFILCAKRSQESLGASTGRPLHRQRTRGQSL